MNSLVQQYREFNPADTRSDAEITLELGQLNDQDGRFGKFQDFVQDYTAIKQEQRDANAPSLGTEFGRAVTRGTAGLGETLSGAAALGSDVVGATGVRDYFLKKAQGAAAIAQENAATIPRVEDIRNASDAVRYAASQAGEVVPSIAEAAAVATVGAVAGSAVGPEGTAGGLLYGLVERQAVKALVKKGVAEASKDLIAAEAKAIATRYGGNLVTAINSFGLSSGEIYNNLKANPNVSDEKAAYTALGLGVVAAAPDTILPNFVLKKFFRGAASEAEKEVASKYVVRLFHDAAKTIPLEAATEGFQELVDIAAERYADPSKRNDPLSHAELSRVVNSAIAGGIGGALAAPVAAIPGPRITADEINKSETAQQGYVPKVTQQDVDYLKKIAKRDVDGDLSAAERRAAVPKELDPVYAQVKEKIEALPAAPISEAKLPEPSAVPRVQDKIEDAAAEVDTNPTEAQKDAGNYKKGHVTFDGLDVTIENPAGSTRTGTDANGKPWEVTLPAHYGYFKNTEGHDGDHVDAYIGPDAGSERVFVVDQIDPSTGRFDEHKTLLHFPDQPSAIAAYDAAFSDGSGPQRRGAITEFTKPEFKAWMEKGETSKAVAYVKPSEPVVKESFTTPGNITETKTDGPLEKSNESAVSTEIKAEKFKDISTKVSPEDAATIGRLLGMDPSFEPRAWMENGKVVVEHKFGLNKEKISRKEFPIVQPEEVQTPSAPPIIEATSPIKTPDAAPAPPPKPAWESRRTKSPEEVLALADFEKGSLVKREGGRGKQAAQAFALTNDREELYKDSRADPNDKNKSRKLGVFLAPDGSHVLIGTAFQNGTGDKASKVTAVNRAGKAGTVSFTELTAGLGYKLVASIKTTEPTKAFSTAMSAAEWAATGTELARKAAEASSGIEAVTEGALGPRTATGDFVDTLGVQVVSASEAAGAPIKKGGAPKGSISLEDAKTLADEIGEPIWNDREEADLQIGDALVANKQLKERLIEQFGQKYYNEEDTKAATTDALYAILDHVYDAYQRANQRKSTDFAGEIAAGKPGVPSQVQRVGGSNNGGPKQTSGQSSVGQSGPKSSQGNQEPGATSGVKFSVAEGPGRQYQASASQVRARFQQALSSLAAAGVDVHLFSVGLDGREFGAHSERTIILGLHDALNPTAEGLRLLLHEATHDVIESLSPEVQQAIHAAISGLSDTELGLERSSDPRIRAANPTGLSNETLTEERLAESIAIAGVDRQAAAGFARAILRSIKELYFRAAMLVQRAIWGRVDENLARSFVANRIDQMTAGSLITHLGGGRPHPSKEARYYTGVTPGLTERLNQTTGQVEYSLVVPDSAVAIAFNMDHARFSLPALKIGDREDPSVIPNIQHAALNEQIALETLVEQAIRGSNLANTEKIDLKEFRRRFKLQDAEALKQVQSERLDPTTKQPVQSNPAQRLGDFGGPYNRDKATHMAYATIQGQETKVGDGITRAKNRIETLTDEKDSKMAHFRKSAQEYTNAEGLTAEIVRSTKAMIRQTRRDLARQSQKLGVVIQQIKFLEDAPSTTTQLVSRYSHVFQKLFTGDQLDGKRLFAFLDNLANDPTIDFNKGIREIRKDMRASQSKTPGLYTELIANTDESRALLATVIAYAKTNERLIALTELRRIQAGDKRAKINAAIQKLFTESEDAAKSVGQVAKTAALEDRLKNAYRRDLNGVRRISRAITKEQTTVKVGELVAPLYAKATNDLAGKLDLRAPTNFADGMIYHVPPHPQATNEEVKAGQTTLALSANGAITDHAKLATELARMAEFLAYRERMGPIDGTYSMVKAQFGELFGHPYESKLIDDSRTALGLVVSAEGDKAASSGTPAGRLFQQMVNKFTALAATMRPQVTRLGDQVMKTRLAARKVLKIDGQPIRQDYYLLNYYSPAVDFIQHQRDLGEDRGLTPEQQLNKAWKRLREYFLDDPTRRQQMAGREDAVMKALRVHVEAEEASSAYYNRQNELANVGVEDEALLTKDATGKSVVAVRRSMPVGPITISKTISQFFRSTFLAMNKSGWAAADFSKLAEELAVDPQATAAKVKALFAEKNVQDLFGHMAKKDTTSAFSAPVLPGGEIRPEADPTITGQAYDQSGGDPLAFADRMFDLHNGTGDRAQYMQEVMETFTALYREMKSVMEVIEPDQMNPGGKVGFLNMIPGLMVNARKVEHWPSSLTTHLSFDAATHHIAMTRVAAQIALGVGGVRINAAYQTMMGEVTHGIQQLKSAEDQVGRNNPSANPKVIRAEVAKVLGSEKELKRLETLREKEPLFKGIEQELAAYFRGTHADVKSVRFIEQLFKVLTGGLLNQPGSALAQLGQGFDVMLTYGASPSTIKNVARTFSDTASDLAKSLAQVIGFKFNSTNRLQQRFAELGLNDPAAAQRLKQSLQNPLYNPESNPGIRTSVANFAHRVRQVQGFGLNLAGEKAQNTVFRPAAPFTMIVQSINRSTTLNAWRTVEELVTRGMDFFAANGQHVTDPTFLITGEAMGLRGAELDSFDKITTNLKNQWGLDYTALVHEAIDRARSGSPDIMSNRTLGIIHGMAMKEVASEPSIASMPAASFNSSTLRFLLALQGWSFRRGMKVLGLRLDEHNRASMAALSRGLLALAAVSAGGLAMGMLIDEYNEDILGKSRNLRKLFGQPDAGNTALAAIEQLNRIGSLGMIGDFINTGVNVGTGQGDNRAISLDQRVVFMSTILGIVRSSSAFINQDFTADYAHVTRPLMLSLGVNGALQYLDIANNLFGLDNTESRFVARINASNYLRAGGRSLDMDVRDQRGGDASYTPVSPYLSAMSLAAYGNDAGAFADAFRQAVAAAKELGKPDPEDYVKRAFGSQHPLRSVFKTTPSAAEYSRLLTSLSDQGQESVTDAVRLFNHYGEQIGVKPFDGKVEKVKTAGPTLDVSAIRRRSLSRAPSFSF